MIPRSVRGRTTTFGVITLGVVLGLAAYLTTGTLEAALRNDLNAQNEQVLDLLAEFIEGGTDPTLLMLPLGSDGTEFVIIDENDAVINASSLFGTPPE